MAFVCTLLFGNVCTKNHHAVLDPNLCKMVSKNRALKLDEQAQFSQSHDKEGLMTSNVHGYLAMCTMAHEILMLC